MPAPTDVVEILDGTTAVSAATASAGGRLLLVTDVGTTDQNITQGEFGKLIRPHIVTEETFADTDLGMVADDPTEAANNLAKLQAYHTANASTVQRALKFPLGVTHFSGQLHAGNDAGYRSFRWTGSGGPAYNAQHQEAGPPLNLMKSELHITGLSGATPWLQVTGSTTDSLRPGQITIEDLTFRIPSGSTGSVLEFGDPATDFTVEPAIIRGVDIRGCYFTSEDLLSTDWLDSDPTDGFTLSAAAKARTFAVRFNRVYDPHIFTSAFRGFGEQVWMQQVDRPQMISTHHIHCLRPALVANPLADYWYQGVPGIFHNVYCETPVISGFVGCQGQWIGVRNETGYSSVVEPDMGVYDMPTGVTWSITGGTDTITLSGLPVGRDATDYFLPFTVIKITPSESYQPPRYYFLTEVAATTLKFACATDSCYTKTTITGNNTAIQRIFGIPMVLAGNRTSGQSLSLGANETLTGVPRAAFVPFRQLMNIDGVSSWGMGVDPADKGKWPVVVGHNSGNQFAMHTGVTWTGGGRAPQSPLCYSFGPRYDANWRPAVKNGEADHSRYDLLAKPGTGIKANGSAARDLQFHYFDDADGNPVACVRMNEASSGWLVPEFETRPFRYTARVYVDAAQVAEGGNNFAVYDGVATHSHAVTGLAAGWHTFSGRGSDAPTLLQINHNRNVFVAWVGVDYLDTDREDYTVSNAATTRTLDAATATTGDVANVLGTLLSDLRAKGLVD